MSRALAVPALDVAALDGRALEVRGLAVVLGGRSVLVDVDLRVERGAWISVVGPNGAGKTTLLHAIAGRIGHDAGTVELFGREIRRIGSRARARLVALVPQTPIVPGGVAVLDYALLGRTPHLPFFGRESRADVDIAIEMLTNLGIVELSERPVDTLSGGERQRAILARALLQEAPLVLLDEPTTSLDIGHQQDVLELVDRLRREHSLTVVSTMHDLTLAGLYADELVLLAGGRIVERGSAVDVLTEDHLLAHFGARVTVLAGEYGPVVVPTRLDSAGLEREGRL